MVSVSISSLIIASSVHVENPNLHNFTRFIFFWKIGYVGFKLDVRLKVVVFTFLVSTDLDALGAIG
jgi:hypothetical protein